MPFCILENQFVHHNFIWYGILILAMLAASGKKNEVEQTKTKQVSRIIMYYR